jgi:hypothetical protein
MLKDLNLHCFLLGEKEFNEPKSKHVDSDMASDLDLHCLLLGQKESNKSKSE